MAAKAQFGIVYTIKSFETSQGRGAERKVGKFGAVPGTLDVMLCLGQLQPGTEITPKGALLALGYGPTVFTSTTRALVDALTAARLLIDPTAPTLHAREDILAQIDAALQGVEAFKAATDAAA